MQKVFLTMTVPLLLAACSLGGTAKPTATGNQSTATSNKMAVELAELNKSGQTGTATLEENNGKLVVTLTVYAEPAAADEPSHIHFGSCPTPGAVKYSLTDVVGGKSVTTLPGGVTLASLASVGPLSINVHKSKTEMGTYTSCGDMNGKVVPTASDDVTR